MKTRIFIFITYITALLYTVDVFAAISPNKALSATENTVEIIGGTHAGVYTISSLPHPITGATKIILHNESGKWNNAQIGRVSAAMKHEQGSKNTLTHFDMSEIVLEDAIDGFIAMFKECASLKTVNLPSAESNVAVNMEEMFHQSPNLETITNLDKLKNIVKLRATFTNTNLSTITLPNVLNNNPMYLGYAFHQCRNLVGINNLDKFTHILDLEGTFAASPKLKNIKFAAVQNGVSAVNARACFQGCAELLSIDNFEKLENISNIGGAYSGCFKLNEIRIGATAASLAAMSATATASAFDGVKNDCIIYLASDVMDVPENWKGYGNFTLPINIADINEFAPIVLGDEISVIGKQQITPSYAIHRDEGWQLCMSGDTVWVTINDMTFVPGIKYDNAKIRYVARRYMLEEDNPELTSSNVAELIIKDIANCKIDTTLKNDIYESITVEAGVDVSVDNNILTDNLILNATQDTYSSIDVQNEVFVKNICINKKIDRYYTYFFSVPFDCSMSDLISANSHLGGYPANENASGFKWAVMRYDENIRATTGKLDGRAWKLVLPNEVLRANIGYTATVNSAVGKDMKLMLSNVSPIKLTELDNVNVVATDGCSMLQRGWNLIAVPAYSKGKYMLNYTDKDGNKSDNIYVNIPLNHATEGYNQVVSSTYEFSPTESFFVQVPKEGTISFKMLNGIANEKQKTLVNNTNIISIGISNSLGIRDYAELVLNDNAPKYEYYSLYDLQKMTVYESIPKIYLIDHDTRLAYSAINKMDYEEVPIGIFLPEAGEYNIDIDLNKNGYYLYDAEKQLRVMDGNYLFESEVTGHIDTRFSLVKMQSVEIELNDDDMDGDLYIESRNDGELVVKGVEGEEVVRLYTNDGKLVEKRLSVNGEVLFVGLPSSVYVVQVGDTTRKVVVY